LDTTYAGGQQLRLLTMTASVPGRWLTKRVCWLGVAALGVAACGGTSGASPTSSATPDIFNTANFNTSGIPWLKANINNNGSPPSTPTGTLTLAGGPDFSDLLDPQAEYETIGVQVDEGYSRRLYYYPVGDSDLSKQVQIVPDVASGMPTVSADGKTYTIHLKSGVMWDTSPPRPVTSQDFEIGLKRECDPVIQPLGNPGYYSTLIAGYSTFCTGFGALSATASPAARKAYIMDHSISGIQTPDSSTIIFTLNNPAVDFLNLLAMDFAAAAPVEELNFIPETPGNPIYSDGPYEIKDCTGTSTATNYDDCSGYNVGHSVTLVPNPNWNASTDNIRHQYVAEIDIKTDVPGGLSGEETVLQEMQAGTTDLAFSSDIAIPPSSLAGFANFKDPNFGAFPAPGDTNPYLVFNVQSNNNNGALKNVKVRQALEYAVDKEALLKIYGGAAFNQVLNQVFGPGAQGYQEFNPYPTPNSSGDPAKCKSMLKAAGYAAGSITLNDFYRTQGNHPAIYQEIKSDFSKCGVTVNGIPVSTGYYGSSGIGVSASTASAGDAQLAQGKWDITEPGWVPDWFGPTNARSILPDLFDGAVSFPGTDWGGYDDPKVDQLVTQAETATSLAAAASLWHQADVQVMRDAAFIPFMTQATPLYHSSKVHNVIYNAQASDYDLFNCWVS
jgi:ABC-type transport system substrate-binding protein